MVLRAREERGWGKGWLKCWGAGRWAEGSNVSKGTPDQWGNSQISDPFHLPVGCREKSEGT